MDFEGNDDLYRPVNWPLRKKLITTLLYGEFLFLHQFHYLKMYDGGDYVRLSSCSFSSGDL